MPTVSIIVPVYNVEQYIRKCIDSILSQTFRDFELILVNDGSSDGSGEICNEYTAQDKRVKVIHKKNGGLSDARNAGIEVAVGTYIGFVDSDDWIEPNMYEILYNLCVGYSADISTCSINVWDLNNKKKTKDYNYNTRVLSSRLAIKCMYDGKLSGYPAWNKLYKREVFDKIRFPVGRIFEDVAIMYRLYGSANRIVFIDSPLYNYNYRESSITRSEFSEKRFDVVLNYNETYSYMAKKYPEICEILEKNFFESLRSMICDIIIERSVIKNYKYLCEIFKLISENNNRIIKNNLIPKKHKVLARFLTWSPLLGLIFYQIRFFGIKIHVTK
jgi:glycosyltransferase involved in cell wall biosynthesis